MPEIVCMLQRRMEKREMVPSTWQKKGTKVRDKDRLPGTSVSNPLPANLRVGGYKVQPDSQPRTGLPFRDSIPQVLPTGSRLRHGSGYLHEAGRNQDL